MTAMGPKDRPHECLQAESRAGISRIDVNHECLGIHCPPNGKRLLLLNLGDGMSGTSNWIGQLVLCFASRRPEVRSGGYRRPLSLPGSSSGACLPCKSRHVRRAAGTVRIDTEIFAWFMACRS